ncbi:Hypothetical predicted protein [Cloeon dipterum]|uniref:tRNA (guanosine(18)-2'-O)-methyltransferase TARBP1 n=1 Tax=Cloeon dipterum TaxID=197152 RepID=A0A8S1CC24_9INSE|nr:Hypothetical predicted protein [Cloeon dipterum]
MDVGSSHEVISDDGRKQIARVFDDNLRALLPLSEEEKSVSDVQRLVALRLACKYECRDEEIKEFESLASAAVSLIMNCQQSQLVPKLLAILRDSLLILPKDASVNFADNAADECLFSFSEEFLFEENTEKTKTFVNLLSQLLNFSSDQNLELMAKIRVVTSHLIFSAGENLSSFAISNLVPKLMGSSEEYITEIWHRLLLHKNNAQLTPLCLLMVLVLSSENPDVAFLQQDHFWQLTQRGLTSQDQMTRKQGRFMLKRALDFINCNQISITWTPQASSLESWNDFFLVMETLEEKQVHIIKPVLPLIEKLFASIGPQWTLVALSQVVSHDNSHVIKWGLEFFFSLEPSSHTSRFLLNKVMPALDNTPLFFESDLDEKLDNFTQKCAALGDVALFKQVLPAIRSISWGPVPLYVVCKALGNVSPLNAWDSDDLDELKHLLLSAMSTQDVFLRATAQSMLLRATLSLVDVSKIAMEPWLDLIASFNRKESIARGSQDWQLLVEFIRKTPQVHFNPVDFVLKVSSKAAARYILLMSDAGLVSNEKIDELASEFELSLQQLQTRLYSISSGGKTQVDDLIELIVEVEAELNQESWQGSILEKVLRPKSIQGIFGYACLKLKREQNEEPQLVRLYTSSLRLFETKTAARLIDAEKIILCARDILESDERSLMSKYFASKVVEHFCKSKGNTDVLWPLKKIIERRALFGSMNNIQFSDQTANFEHKENRNKIVSSVLTSNWNCLLALLEGSEALTLPHATLLSLAEDAVEISGPETLPFVMLCLKHCLHQEMDTRRVVVLLEKCYSKCFEHRKSELFWLDIRAFIKMAFDARMLVRNDLVDCLVKITEDLHEQSQIIAGLFNLVVENLCDQNVNEGIIFTRQLCLALLFGPVLRRDQKILTDFSLKIISQGEKIPANVLVGSNCLSSQYIRAKALKFLLLNKADESQIAALLIKRDVELSTNKKLRYFAESQVHRIKHRIAQSLLIIGCTTKNSEVQSTILNWATCSLAEENHQPSVRYMMEWLVALILVSNTSFEDGFIKQIQEATSKRLNSIPSFVSVLYLWIVSLVQNKSRNQDLARLIRFSIDLMLPWCMAQNYNIRLYAQVALLRIFSVCEDHSLEEHSCLKRGVRSSVEQSSGVKNAVKLQEDFFFSVFDPIKHLSLETILVEFPRLTNVGQDEWLPNSFFAFDNASEVEVKLENSDDSLAKSKVANWILKATGAAGDNESQDECLHLVVQRKVTPWRDMFAENSARDKRTPPLEGLVVVASLVDKAPNLGGLSRTCEIFGASQLIIGNMKILDDIAFKSLSVTAEKWINLSEVKPENLVEYLQFMKNEGYTLMAAEQTSKSVPLQSVEFNKKSLLLLGNEKEGIPAELLPFLDVCVEIPQMGVIRSLNVHVTGALFIWQYFQQHHLAPEVKKQ